jgi:hypothetical protein
MKKDDNCMKGDVSKAVEIVAELLRFSKSARVKLVDVARFLEVSPPTIQNYKKRGTATLAATISWAGRLGYELKLVPIAEPIELADGEVETTQEELVAG